MTAHYHDIAAEADRSPALPAATSAVLHGRPAARRPALPRPGGLYRRGAKRALDVVLVLLAAPVVVPVVLILALLVALDGGRPFYVQARVGRHGRRYRMWKLRSMVADADTRLEAHLAADPAARAEWDAAQKLRDDPRVTRLGATLRKTSLDELPQLWNVLRGDMSLVGPRPMMPSQQALYPGQAYYRLRPGITGPWQVSSRNATTFADRARFDAAYERDLSLATDLRLLAATVRVVVRATGC
jgi:lipopolysaccharide/colanic/teichoic acid biosynthesis glycosyltransferase